MKLFKEIFGRTWALWGILTFIATFLIIFIPSMLTYLIPGKRGQEIFIIISRMWMRVWLFLVACPLKVRGWENFKKSQTYIVTCNHNSLMDVPLSCPFIPGANKTIAKKSFTKAPLFGWFYAKGSVLVDRHSDESRRRSFVEMKQTLKQGMHMSIYPEGTRNRSNDPLKSFHDGAFRLAAETGNSIIPAVIFNTKKVLPVNKFFYFLPHRLEIHFLPSVSPEGKQAKALKQEVFDIMWNYYNDHRGRS
jgi:1-acyl-sn-glycerol-3-phosphate acyltransferase